MLEVSIIPIVGFVMIYGCLYGTDAAVNTWLLGLSIIYAVSYLLVHSPVVQVNRIDWALFIVVLAETAGYFNSTYRVNSLHGYHEALFLLLFYCFVKLHLRREYQQLGVLLLISLFALCFSATTLFSFYQEQAQITLHGFDDPTNFRQFFRSFQTADSPVGEWITLWLALLPFPVLLFVRFERRTPATWLLLAPVVMSLTVITATFSRGLYIATAVFFVSACGLFRLYQLGSLKRLIGFSAAALLLLVLILCVTPLGRPALNTAALFKTNSQVRSLEGRASLWKVSWEVFQDHPLFGVGAYNFPMQYAAYKDEDDVYVGRTFNIFLQLLVEKGAIGFLAYGLLFFSFLKTAHERARQPGDNSFQKTVTVVFMAAFTALLVRDLSYSSVLTNKGVSTLLWFIFAHAARPRPLPDAVRATDGPLS